VIDPPISCIMKGVPEAANSPACDTQPPMCRWPSM
jgi:hypothetical protein